LPQGSRKGAGKICKGLEEDSGRRNADPINNTRTIVTDNLVAAANVSIHCPVLSNNHIVAALALIVTQDVTIEIRQGAIDVGWTGLDTSSSVQISSSWVIKIRVGVGREVCVWLTTNKCLLICGSVDVFGVSFAVTVKSEREHHSDVNHHQ
jgi:hypothetical protein